jgi:quercetin 2,3-dioxygenase
MSPPHPTPIAPFIVIFDVLPQISGEPLDQTVYQMGPFVMTTREEIEKTILDYRMGKNGFEKAHTWKSKIGNM